MAKIRYVVTHPGGAHKDDVLAACVLIATHECPIFRREPSADELADATIAIVDIGGDHDPLRNNFDHHHFPREHPPTCALSLLLQSLNLYEDALQFCDWLEPAEWFDSRGPKKTAEWLEVSRRAISRLNSPIDITLLRRFAARAELHPGEVLYEYMRMVGDDLLSYLRIARERIDFVAEHTSRWTVGTPELGVIFLPRTELTVDEPSGSIASYIRDAGIDSEIAAMVYPDRRGEGYGISRYEDHPQLDFSRVESLEDVHFAHKSGFLCKTSTRNEERLREIIELAICK